MPARGDITASEIFQDRELLNRLGYGIFDVAWGKNWIGSENVRDFSYIIAPDFDPKIYRHKVYEVLGRYYDNQLAKRMWYNFLEHKLELSEQAGREVELKTAAQAWFARFGYAFLKEWALHQPQVPERIRNLAEPSRNWTSVVAELLLPGLKDLFEAGFSLSAILKAAYLALLPLRKSSYSGKDLPFYPSPLNEVSQSKKVKAKKSNQLYMRVVAMLTGHPIHTRQEVHRQWHEILEHQSYLNKYREGEVSVQIATVDYYRRLALLEALERGYEQS